jgi:hypothetical protein
MNKAGIIRPVGVQAQMDRNEQPRLSESAAIIVAATAFVVLVPTCWLLLTVFAFSLCALANRASAAYQFVVPIAVASTTCASFLTWAVYEFARSPKLPTTLTPRIRLSVYDWTSAAVSFFVIWLLMAAFAPSISRLLGINPMSPADTVCFVVFPPAISTMNTIMFLRGRKRKKLAKLQESEISAGLFCRCGYNLTGNVSGVCPECGATL